MDNNLLKRLFR